MKIEDSEFGKAYGHSGSTSSGFITNFIFYEKFDAGFVVFTNSNKGGILSIAYLNQLLITGKGEQHTR